MEIEENKFVELNIENKNLITNENLYALSQKLSKTIKDTESYMIKNDLLSELEKFKITPLVNKKGFIKVRLDVLSENNNILTLMVFGYGIYKNKNIIRLNYKIDQDTEVIHKNFIIESDPINVSGIITCLLNEKDIEN